jgi:hypothetical protein
MHVLVLGVLPDPRDDDVVAIPKDEMHPPIAVEAPLADSVVHTRLGTHPDATRLAPSMSKLLDRTIEVLLDRPAQSFHARIAARATTTLNRDAISQPARPLGVRSQVHDVADQSVSQPLLGSRLFQCALIGGLP